MPEDWSPPEAKRDLIPPPPHLDRGLDRVRATIHEWFDSNGFDPQGRIEWPCAWGESDMYQLVETGDLLMFKVISIMSAMRGISSPSACGGSSPWRVILGKR